jgi:multidrug efflux pump subunit AcrB
MSAQNEEKSPPIERDEAAEHTGFNTARFFVQQHHIAWALFFMTLAWGVYSYFAMPQRKDPDIPMRVCAVICGWPGAKAEKVEERITRRIEEKVAENAKVERIESKVRSGLSVSIIKLVDDEPDPHKIFDDIGMKLSTITDLPDGAGAVNFIKDFGDTAALMLTVSGPKVSEVELEIRAKAARAMTEELRKGAQGERMSMLLVYPQDSELIANEARRKTELLAAWLKSEKLATDSRVRLEPGMLVLDAATNLDEAGFRDALYRFAEERLGSGSLHPDIWPPAVFRDTGKALESLSASAGDKYTWRELEAFTDELRRGLSTVPTISKVTRWGVRNENVFLEYSQERLAPLNLDPGKLKSIIAGRNIALPGGVVDIAGRNILLDPSGEFTSERDLANVLLTSDASQPAYLRDVVDIRRAYSEPAENINYYYSRDEKGRFVRTKAVSLAVEMRAGEQIRTFSKEVDAKLADMRSRLPDDLIVARTSDQPLQVEEKIDLFMRSLFEAILLVVAVAFVGFREWRSALLMAASIPITLAMTFGFMHALGLDLQQISIASLILALGLLVDDPVVAGDAIKREMAAGKPRALAAWLGPTKLAKAILYATITNIVAYLPFLMLSGDKGRFLYSMPVVVTASLVASRIVSMTFIPLLGEWFLRRPKKLEPSVEERRERGFGGVYYRVGSALIEHRWKALAGAVLLAGVGFWFKAQLNPQFFPTDLSYLSYVDVWMPEDASIQATNDMAEQVEPAIVAALERFDQERRKKDPNLPPTLRTITSFIGGGGPRFWFSVTPELKQTNYAQLVIEVSDSRQTNKIVAPLQEALSRKIPGARVDVRLLETGPPVGVPVQVRLYGDSIPALREQAERIKNVFNADQDVVRLSDNWGAESFRARFSIDADKANLAGATNLDVATSAQAAASGITVATLNDGRLRIPVVARMRPEERAKAEDIQNLYVATSSGARIPLGQISTFGYNMEIEKIARRNQYRCITVSCFPTEGVLPSQIIARAMPALQEIERTLPPGLRMEIGGEYEEQVKGFKELGLIMSISIFMIYLALLFQFKNAVKPLIVFAAIPFGMTGAFAALWLMGQPFGFMAFLGVASLIGVIVSHIIVLFDFIEEKREHGQDLRSALLDAGIIRLRPVLITVGATVIALIPLARSGGPLWEPLCYAQIGGLCAATFVTLLIVPVLYAIAVFDLKVVK